MGELAWGTPLILDLWMAGIAGGAYFAAFLIYLFGADEEKRLLKLATYIGVPLVLLGVLALVIDLGEPFRAQHLFVGLRPSSWHVVSGYGAASLGTWPPSLTLYPISPMSLGSWILVVWSVTAVALIALWFAEIVESPEELGGIVGEVAYLLRPLVPATKVLTWIGLVFAILMMTYTGVVLSASSQALWQATFLLPSLFVTSATSTGVAVLLIMARLAGARQRGPAMAQLRKALAVLIVMQLAVLVGFLLWLGAAGLVGPLISGRLGTLFWIGVVLLGLLVPLGLESSALRRKAEAMEAAAMASPVLVLLGGLVLRAVVVIGGQI